MTSDVMMASVPYIEAIHMAKKNEEGVRHRKFRNATDLTKK